MTSNTHEPLVWELLKQINKEISIDKGLLESIGRCVTTPMAKWLASEYSDSAREYEYIWMDKASNFLAEVEKKLNKQKQSIADELSRNGMHCDANELELIGDYHGQKSSTLRCRIGERELYVKPNRHHETGNVYDSLLDLINSNLPRCRQRLVMKGTDFIVEEAVRCDSQSVDYNSFGEFATVCFFLGLIDLHGSNVIFQNGVPILLDPECILNPPGFGRLEMDADSLGVLSLYRTGLFGHTRHMRNAGVVNQKNLIENWLEFSNGVTAATERILMNIDAINSFFSSKHLIKVRRLPRETAFYFKAIQDSWHPLVLTDEITHDEVFSRYYSLPSGHPFLKIRDYEQDALRKGEIPLFMIDAVSGIMESSDLHHETISEITCQDLISANTDIIRKNGAEYLLNSLRMSLGVTNVIVGKQPDSCIDAIVQRLHSSTLELPHKKVFIDMHLEPDGPAGVKAIGPGIMNGAGGIILSLSDLENHDLIEDLAKYALTTGLSVREDGGYGLFFGPLSGFLSLSLISQKYPYLKTILNNHLSHTLEAHAKVSASNRFSDLSHGFIGSILILNYLKKQKWISDQNLVCKALVSERQKLKSSVERMLKLKFKGVLHGCESLCFIWDEVEMNCRDLADKIIEKVREGIIGASKECSTNWCNGITGIPLEKWAEFPQLSSDCHKAMLINQKVRRELKFDNDRFESWFPCHGEIIALNKISESEPRQINPIGSIASIHIDTPITLSYGTGLAGVISTFLGNESWLIRALTSVTSN